MDASEVLLIGETLPAWVVDRKATGADLDADAEDITPERTAEVKGLKLAADAYLDVYDGDFGFMVDMRAQWIDGAYPLSPGKYAGVINCLRAEVAYIKRRTTNGGAKGG